MGEAKRRGTLEERKKQSIGRGNKWEEEEYIKKQNKEKSKIVTPTGRLVEAIERGRLEEFINTMRREMNSVFVIKKD